MDEGGTPINKAPCLANKDLDLYKLYRLVKELGGFHRVTAQMKWGYIYSKLHLPQHFTAGPRNLQAAFKRYLYPLDDVSRKLGTDLDELPLSRPRHQTLANQNASQSAKSGAVTMGGGSRQPSASIGQPSAQNGHKTVSSTPKSIEKSTALSPVIVASSASTAVTATASVTSGPISPNNTEFSPPKVVGIEPVVESTSFSSPPVLSPLMTSHERSPTPETSMRSAKIGSKRDDSGSVPMEGVELVDNGTGNLSESRANEEPYEAANTRTRSFADAWKSSSSLLELSISDGTQVNRIIPIGSRVRVRCGDRVAYEAKVLKHIRPQPEFRTRSASKTNNGNTGVTDCIGNARTKWSASSEMQYRVHYMGWNRRHDEVVSRSRIIAVIKWARPVDSFRPPSCSSLNLVVQEPRSKTWASTRKSGKLRRVFGIADRSTGSLTQTRGGGRNPDDASLNKQVSLTSSEKRRHLRKSSASTNAKDPDKGESGDDDDIEDEDDQDDHENYDEEEEDDDDDEPDVDSDQSQTTETASDIVTTMAPVVRRRRMMFGKVLTPGRRIARIQMDASAPTRSVSSVSTRSETGSSKRPASTRDSVADLPMLTCSPHLGVTLERLKPDLGISGSVPRSEVTDSAAPSGKRARLGAHSTDLTDSGKTRATSIVNPDGLVSMDSSTYPTSKVDSETDGDTGKHAAQNQRPELVAPAEQPHITVAVSKRKNVSTPVTAPTVAKALTSSNSNSDAVTPVTKKLPSANQSTREKTDRSGLKRPLTYGARRVSVIKGDKIRSLKRTASMVGNATTSHKRITPLRKGSPGSTTAPQVVMVAAETVTAEVATSADDGIKLAAKSRKKLVTTEPSIAKAVGLTRATKPTAPDSPRVTSTERIKTPQSSTTPRSSKTINALASDEKANPVVSKPNSASSILSSKQASKTESTRKVPVSRPVASEKDSVDPQPIKPRPGKPTAENKSSASRNKSKGNKSETPNIGTSKTGSVAASSPAKRATGSRVGQTLSSKPNRSRNRSVSSSSSSSPSSSDSSSSCSGASISPPVKKSRKLPVPSKGTGSTTAADTATRRGRDTKRSAGAKRDRPVTGTAERSASNSSNSSGSRSDQSPTSSRGNKTGGRRSSSSASSSSSSSDYGNMDALPRLTRSQHRQLLGDTPPGAALQTAAPVNAVTSSSTGNTSTTTSAPIKPEPPIKETTSKSIVKPELKENPSADDVDKKPTTDDVVIPYSGSKSNPTSVSPNQTAAETAHSAGIKDTRPTAAVSFSGVSVVVTETPSGVRITPRPDLDKNTTKSPHDSLGVIGEDSSVTLPSPKNLAKPRGRSKLARSTANITAAPSTPRERSAAARPAQPETSMTELSPLNDSQDFKVEQCEPQKIEDTEGTEPSKMNEGKEDEEITADEEDEQSSVHTVSTDPMKGVLFDLTMSPDAVTPIRSSSSDSVSACSRAASVSSSDSENEEKCAPRLTVTATTTIVTNATSTPVSVRTDCDKLADSSAYRESLRMVQGNKKEEVEDDEEDEASVVTDAEEDEEDDNTSAPSTTGGSKGSVELRKRSEVAPRGSVEPEAEAKPSRAEQEPAVHKTSTRRRQASVCSSSTENAGATSVSRKGLKRAQGTPQRSLAFDRSPTPNSDSPHYSHSPVHSSTTSGNVACGSGTPLGNKISQSQVLPQHPGPRLLASQRRFGGPFFPIQGLDEMHTEVKCQILQDRMHQIVEAWRLAKQYLKDLDQRTNRTRRLRARTTGPDGQNTGSGTPVARLSGVSSAANVSVSATNSGLGSTGDQHRMVAPI